MSDTAPSDDASTDGDSEADEHGLLAELADDFARRYRGGERPSIEAYARAHPALADQVRDLFPGMVLMEQSGVGAAAQSWAATEAPGATIGRYTLIERLGEGGFGVVFVAEQQQPVRRRVALKVIKPGMDSGQVIARFEAERQALTMMEHPNIAKVLDAGATDAGRSYFRNGQKRRVSVSRSTEGCGYPISAFVWQRCRSIVPARIPQGWWW